MQNNVETTRAVQKLNPYNDSYDSQTKELLQKTNPNSK